MQPKYRRHRPLPLLVAGLFVLGLVGAPCEARADDAVELPESIQEAPAVAEETPEEELGTADETVQIALVDADVTVTVPDADLATPSEIEEPTTDIDDSAATEDVADAQDSPTDPDAQVASETVAATEASEQGEAPDEIYGEPASEAPSDETAPSEEQTPKIEPLAAAQDVSDQLPLEAANSWVKENGSYYYYENGTKKTGWLVNGVTPQGARGSLQRYWLDGTGKLATSRLIPASEAGWWAYAQPLGTIVRGKWTDSSTGYVYLANNDGKLENPGWLVSTAYDSNIQRYYIDAKKHACVPGYSTDGWNHYTTSQGYVFRGISTTKGAMRMADNDGRMVQGWIVTNQFGQGLQRYWQDKGTIAADKLVKTGSSTWAYARPEGYVVRGRYTNPTNGYVYLANNDGRLVATGWLVTPAFDGGLQRYYINPNSHAAQTGFFQAPMPNAASRTGWFYALPNLGYVSRGKMTMTPGVLIADNEGILAESEHAAGWMVTTIYDAGAINRYYLRSQSGHLYARTGFFTVDGKSYYGIPNHGYVHRGKLATSNGILIANNDGHLAESTYGEGWVITQQYDGRLQRYYLKKVNGHLYASTGFFKVGGSSFYGFPDEGYVHRGKLKTTHGILIANNEGVLAESAHGAGWMITKEYDGVLQRYYLQRVNGHLYAKTGFFRVGNRSYQGLTGQGYVARNTTVVYRGSHCTTDNEGVMRYSDGCYALVSTRAKDSPLRILLLGNSFTNYNNNLIAATLRSLLGAEVSVSASSGATLGEHLNRSTAIGSQTMASLSSGKYDYVIVQELSTNPIDNSSTYYKNLAQIVKTAHTYGATPVIYGTWAYAGTGNESSLNGAGSIRRGISTQTMHNRLQSTFQTASNRNDISVANVGNAFATRSFASSLYGSDSKHPSEAGSRLAGQIISNTIKELQRTS